MAQPFNDPVSGRIDYAGDIGIFRFEPLQNWGSTIRLSNLAFGIVPHVRIWVAGEDQMLIDENVQADLSSHFSYRLPAGSGITYYLAVSASPQGTDLAFYKVSRGAPYTVEGNVHLFLPTIQR